MATLDPLRVEVRRVAEKVAQEAGSKLEQTLRQTSPIDTGLMQSRTMVQTRGLVSTAKVATEYASFVAEGTRGPYKIPKTPKKGKSRLRFKPKGSSTYVYARQVTHPGITANPWWENALRKWHGFLEEGFR